MSILYVHKFFDMKNYNKYPVGSSHVEEIASTKDWSGFHNSERGGQNFVLIETKKYEWPDGKRVLKLCKGDK